jgi:hypothetical protein
LFKALKKAGYRLELRYVGLESVALCSGLLSGYWKVAMMYLQHLHVLGLHRAVFQHGFYHRIFRDAAGEDVFRQLVQNHTLEHALERADAELRVIAGFAQVVEHFAGGFELDAGLGQALLDLPELDVHDAAGAFFFESTALSCCTLNHRIAMSPNTSVQPTRLTPIQVRLLRLFERGMSDEDTLELQRVIVAHLSRKMLDEVERIDTERGYTAEDYERMLNEPS